jgi:hypothetical protein
LVTSELLLMFHVSEGPPSPDLPNRRIALAPFGLDSSLARHVDSFRAATNRIEMALFTDGLKRVVQTKKDAAVSPQGGTAPTDVMVVSGRVLFDPLRAVEHQVHG